MTFPNFKYIAASLRRSNHQKPQSDSDAPSPTSGTPAGTTDHAKIKIHDDYLIAPILAVILVYVGSAMLTTAIVEFNPSSLADAPLWTENRR
ncbi:MAG: hypothetical protein ACFB5Z_18680 [Elainellaceae cyanobacterium]